MSVEININDHEKGKIYCPGDTASGTIHLKGPFNDTALSDYASYSDGGFLFNSPSQVFEGPCVLLPGLEIVFNFSLKFPYTTKQCTGYSAQAPWLHSDHPLPPSIRVEGRTYKGKISYRLVVITRSARENGESRVKLWQQENLLLRRTPLTAAPNYTLQSIDQPLRRPKMKERQEHRSFFKWLDDTIQFNKPSSGMSLQAYVPSSLKLDVIPSILLELIQSNESVNASLHEARIRDVQHKIKATTWVRGAGEFGGKDCNFRQQWIVKCSSVQKSTTMSFKCKNLQRVMRLGDKIDIGDDLGVVIPEASQPSSFQSYAVSRTHSSKTIVKVDVGGRRKKLVFKLPELDVLPAPEERETIAFSTEEKRCLLAFLRDKICQLHPSHNDNATPTASELIFRIIGFISIRSITSSNF